MVLVSTGVVPSVRIHGRGAVQARDYAVDKLAAALRHAPGPVLFARLTLDSGAPGERVDAQVDVDGIAVHVHAVGDTMTEAIDRLQERMRARLRRMRRRPTEVIARRE
jgi:ribosome-associated translation inhibitor RaiA